MSDWSGEGGDDEVMVLVAEMRGWWRKGTTDRRTVSIEPESVAKEYIIEDSPC